MFQYHFFEFYGYSDTNFLKEKFQSSDGFFSWLLILFSAGFTPLPFKLFTIFSGFIQFNLITFFFVSLISRGLRFFVVAYFTAKFGEPFVKFLEKKWISFKELFDKKNISRKDCLLLPLRTVNKALNDKNK